MFCGLRVVGNMLVHATHAFIPLFGFSTLFPICCCNESDILSFHFKLLEYQISVFRQAHKHDDDSVAPPLSSKLTTLIKLTLMVTFLSGVLYRDFHIYPLLTIKYSLPSSN